MTALALVAAVLFAPRAAQAQNLVSVAFTRGFIGGTGANAGQADTVKSFATLGITRMFFLQNSSSTSFEIQGNDIPGTLRFVGTNGTSVDIAGSVVWRQTASGTTYLVGFVPSLASNVTWNSGVQTITFSNGSVGGGTNVGAYFNSYPTGSIPSPLDGTSQSGNAAQSGALDGLNEYLAEVNAQRPTGPVTVNPVTVNPSTAPTLTGTVTLQAGENLTVVVNGVQYAAPDVVVNSGAGTWSLTLPSALAAGTYSVTATITDADGYTLTDTSTNELTVANTLTIGGSFTANDKVYNGLLPATGDISGLTLSGSPAGVTIASATLAFQTAAVGTGKTVVITGITLGGPNAGSYTVDLTGAPTATAAITAKELTIGGSFTADNKTYDGLATATIATNSLTLTGLVAGDVGNVSLTSLAAAFADAAAANGKTVSLTTASLSGTASGNYTVTVTGAPTTTANITPKQLTIGGSFTASNKVYDGNTTATIASNSLTLTGLVAGDVGNVALTGLTAAFADATVGNGKTVSLTAASLSGTASGNYTVTVSGAPTTTADITSSSLTIGGSFTANDKVYDGGLTATGSTGGLTLSGSPAGVTIASVTLAFQSASVGTGKTVVITGVTLGGANAGSYTVDLTGAPTATAAITPKQLTISGAFTANNKPFDGTATATIASNTLTLTGLEAGDIGNVSLTGLAAAFANAAVGNGKTVSLTAASLSGTASGNYSVTVSGAPTTTANITAAALTIGGSFTANDKVYDATVAATGNTAGLTLSGSPAGVTIASVTLAFQSASAGTGKTVVITGITLGGPNAASYAVNLTGAPTATAAITRRTVTIGGTFTAADKLFDGNTNATISSNVLSVRGAVGGDALGIGSLTIQFASPEVGQARQVNITAATLVGPAAGNYVLSLAGAPTTTAAILPAAPPGPVRNLRGTAGDQRLSISFDIPETPGCSPITSYVVEYSGNNGATWTRLTTTSRSLDIAPVVNNITYLVRVAAVNSCGQGPWTEIGDLVPFAPVRNNGELPTVPPGTVTVSQSGPTTLEVVKDTVLRVNSPDYTISVRSTDVTGAAIPVAGLTLQLEQGGNASTEGTGFGPGTWVTLYIYGADKQPRFLGRVLVRADGTFATSFPIPADLAEGPYTLQVNGVDAQGRARNAALGVEVVEPTPELVFTSVPNRTEMTVGDTVTFTLSVKNDGRGAAIDVVIPRAFDEPGFRFVSATPIDGRFDAPTNTWTIPRIERGATARLTLRAIVVPPIPAPAPSLESTGGSTR